MIKLVLPWPVSANDYWSSRVVRSKTTGKNIVLTFSTDEAKAYKERVQWLCVAAGIRSPIVGRVAIDIKLYPHRPLDWQKRMRDAGELWDNGVKCLDLDNVNKVLFDALKDVAFEDDKWVWRLTSERMEPDGGEARVVLSIAAIAPAAPQAAIAMPAQPEALPF